MIHLPGCPSATPYFCSSQLEVLHPYNIVKAATYILFYLVLSIALQSPQCCLASVHTVLNITYHLISPHNTLMKLMSTAHWSLFVLQVQRTGNFGHTFKLLWAEEKMGILSKGLSPRLFQSVIFSFTIILGYESVKRFSVSDEYKNEVKWWLWVHLGMTAVCLFVKVTSFVLNKVCK